VHPLQLGHSERSQRDATWGVGKNECCSTTRSSTVATARKDRCRVVVSAEQWRPYGAAKRRALHGATLLEEQFEKDVAKFCEAPHDSTTVVVHTDSTRASSTHVIGNTLDIVSLYSFAVSLAPSLCYSHVLEQPNAAVPSVSIFHDALFLAPLP